MAMLDSTTEMDDELGYATPIVSGAMDTFPEPGMQSSFGAQPSADASAASGSGAGGMFPCLTVAYYQAYFNVDTSDVTNRLFATLKFYKSEPTFLNLIGDAPDLYGPFWIASTLIFVISVTSNFAKSLKDGINYDFELVTGCLSLVYGYLVCLPSLFWAVFKYWLHIPHLSMTQLACLVGYSLVLWFPGCCVSTANSLSWPALAVSCGASTLFLMRSLRPIVEPRRQNVGVSVVGVLVVLQVLFMLCLKFQFYSHKDLMHPHHHNQEVVPASETTSAALDPVVAATVEASAAARW